MCEREPRNGYVVVSIELPTEVADLLVERQGDFLTIIEAIGRECRRLPPSAEVQAEANRLRELKNRQRLDEIKRRGRLGYRLIRRYGGSKHIVKQRDLLERIGLELGVSAELIELNIVRFKSSIEAKVRKRRGREIERYYWAGESNSEIAARFGVHRNTVARYIREVIKPTGRRA